LTFLIKDFTFDLLVKKPKKMELKETYDDMPQGSVFEVTSETKLFYKGIWASMWGTYPVKVPKKICKRFYKPYWTRVFEKMARDIKKKNDKR
jgi:hypothetical protein